MVSQVGLCNSLMYVWMPVGLCMSLCRYVYEYRPTCSLYMHVCIVLYLCICIALLEVHTNQKRFQCERPREKIAVLRERKEALCSPVNKSGSSRTVMHNLFRPRATF